MTEEEFTLPRSISAEHVRHSHKEVLAKGQEDMFKQKESIRMKSCNIRELLSVIV
jgi:hypothetical protein